MRKSFKDFFLEDDSTPAIWSISYTIIDPKRSATTEKGEEAL